MLNWNEAQTVRTDYAEGDVTRVTLPNGHVSFNVFQKNDYWLVWIQAGDDVIRADDDKQDGFNSAQIWAEDLYEGQWAVLCLIDLVGGQMGRPISKWADNPSG